MAGIINLWTGNGARRGVWRVNIWDAAWILIVVKDMLACR
jgi:hypothetical protein